MTLADREFFDSGSTSGPEPRFYVRKRKTATLAAQSGAPTLPYGTPVAWDSDNSVWNVYTQPSDHAIYTITDQAGGTDGGSFELAIDGLSATFAWDVTAATMQSTLAALLVDAGKTYTVTCSCDQANLGVNGAVMTLTFSESAGAPSVSIDTAGLTDGGVAEPANLVLAASDAGTQISAGLHQIRGFVGDEAGVATDATNQVQFLVIQEANMHRDDINTAAIRAVLGGSPSANELDAALKDKELRKLRLFIDGLAGVM